MDEHGAVVTSAPDCSAPTNMGPGMYVRVTSQDITSQLCKHHGDTANCDSYVIGALHCRLDNPGSGSK